MFLFFLPPVVQAVIGVALIAAGLLLHLYILAPIGAAGLVIAGARWVRSGRRAIQR